MFLRVFGGRACILCPAPADPKTQYVRGSVAMPPLSASETVMRQGLFNIDEST